MSKIYTKTGDDGQTGLFAGPRVCKDDLRIEAYGTVDELNAMLGLARAAGLPEEIDPLVRRLQDELFDVGAELATPVPSRHGMRQTAPAHVEALEAAIDLWDATLPALAQFILPGGSPAAAQLHVARTVCRRAERRVITLANRSATDPSFGPINPQLIVYLNRLSDLLFVLARAANHLAGVAEDAWTKREANG